MTLEEYNTLFDSNSSRLERIWGLGRRGYRGYNKNHVHLRLQAGGEI